MNHRKSMRRFNRTGSHRKAMLQSLANALIHHEQIETTEAKAKDLRRVVEKLVSKAKKDSVANRRLVFSKLRNRDNVTKLFNDLGKHFDGRHGGYTRVLKMGYRAGDAAPTAIIQFVDRDDQIQAIKDK